MCFIQTQNNIYLLIIIQQAQSQLYTGVNWPYGATSWVFRGQRRTKSGWGPHRLWRFTICFYFAWRGRDMLTSSHLPRNLHSGGSLPINYFTIFYRKMERSVARIQIDLLSGQLFVPVLDSGNYYRLRPYFNLHPYSSTFSPGHSGPKCITCCRSPLWHSSSAGPYSISSIYWTISSPSSLITSKSNWPSTSAIWREWARPDLSIDRSSETGLTGGVARLDV